MTTHTKSQAVEMFGVPIDAVTMDQAIGKIAGAIESRSPLHIGVVNAAKLVNMQRDPQLRASVLESDVIFADGMSVVWASRLLGRPLPARVAGIDLMYAMLRLADRRGYRVACLGAEEDVLRKTVDYIREHYPGARVVASRNGYFSSAEEPEVAAQIAAAKPDMLFVAMTSPKKENFLARWNSLIAVPVSHGVGGSFDVVAGKVRRAPELWQRLGLEWLYRVKQEPLRLWRRYTVTNTQFIAMVLGEMFGRRSSSATPKVDVVGAGAPRR